MQNMNDFLEVLNQYKDIKDVLDLVGDIQKLRFYYSTQQYKVMIQYIQHLVVKYPVDTFIWNSFNSTMPDTYDQAYQNAENFLRLKGFSLLIQKGCDLSQNLNQEEIAFIEKMIKPME